MARVQELLWRVAPEGFRTAFIRNLGLPTGRMGSWVGRQLARANAPHDDLVRRVLDLGDGDLVLEFGLGPGTTANALLADHPSTRVVGIDPSPVMLRQARRRNRGHVTSGRLELREGATHRIDLESNSVDAAFGCNVLYFWRDPAVDLAELRRVLRPGGRLGLGFRPREGADPELVRRFHEAGHQLYDVEQVDALFLAAGFERPTMHADDDGWTFAVAQLRERVATDDADDLTDEEVHGHWFVVD